MFKLITIAGTNRRRQRNRALAQQLVPRVSINDAFTIEGSAPSRTVVGFEVTLTVASDLPVTVEYATEDGTATAASESPRRGAA